MAMIPINTSPADVISTHTSRDNRYRAVQTPRGYLITARSRDQIGLLVSAQWLHRTEESARACVHTVIACDQAFAAMATGQAESANAVFSRASDAHKEVCVRLSGEPIIGREVQELRERLMQDDEPPGIK